MFCSVSSSQQSLSEEDLSGLSALQNKEGSSSDDDCFLTSSHELRLGNIQNALRELSVDHSSLASLLSKRLDITWNSMVKAKESYTSKEWDAVLKHTSDAIEQGVDLCTELYLHRAEAYLASNLVEDTVTELSSAILCLLKTHGFKAPDKKEVDHQNFVHAIVDITQDQVEKLLKVEEEELQLLKEELSERLMGLEAVVLLIKDFYEPLINERADRIQLLKNKQANGAAGVV